MLTDVLGVSSDKKSSSKLTKAIFISNHTLKITSKQLGDFILVGRSKIFNSGLNSMMVAKKRAQVRTYRGPNFNVQYENIYVSRTLHFLTN